MPAINSLLRTQVQSTVHEDSVEAAERALAEILENHRAAGHEVSQGLHDGHPAWHVVTVTGSPYAVFWISDPDGSLT